MTVTLPLSSTVAPNVSASLRRGGDPVIAGRIPGQPGEFTRVRGQHGRRGAVDHQIGMGGKDGQPVGVDDHRQVGLQREPQRGGPGVVGAQSRPDHPGLHPPGRRRGGRRDHLGPVREHLAVRAAGVADHAGGGRDGGAGAQHGRARDTSTSRPSRRSRPGCTCRRGVRAPASARPTSAASKPSTSVSGRSRPMSTSSTRPQSPSACTGLSPPKVTVSAACTAGPVIGSGRHVDAAGDVDGDDRDRVRHRR